jgi:hypothetical protein
MGWRGMLIATLLCLAVPGVAQVARRPNRGAAFEPEMQNPVDDPPDAWEKSEGFPDRDAIEIPDDHAVWQVVYDLRQRYHIPGYQIAIYTISY